MRKAVKNLISLLSASVIGIYAVGALGNYSSRRGLSQPKRENSEIAVSLHNHTPVLGERDSALEALIDSAFNEKMDVVALTDANSEDNFYYLKNNSSKILPDYRTEDIGSALKISEKSNFDKSIYLLAGYEFHRDSGHVLIIGQKKNISLNESSTAENAIDAGAKDSAIIIFPHPFATELGIGGIGAEKLNSLYREADAIESFNAQAICLYPYLIDIHKANIDAKKFSEEKNFPGIATSDSHIASHVGLSYILVERGNMDFTDGSSIVKSLKDAIKNQEFRNYEKYSPWTDSFRWLFAARIKR
jgi:hypothetical protein